MDLVRGMEMLTEPERALVEAWALGTAVIDESHADEIIERLRGFVDTGTLLPGTERVPVSDEEAVLRASRRTDKPSPVNAEARMLAARYTARTQRIGAPVPAPAPTPADEPLPIKSAAAELHQRRIDATPRNPKRKRGVNHPSRTAANPGSRKARRIAQRKRR